MAIVENVVIPIVTLIAYMVMGGWFLFLIWKGFKMIFPNFKWILKYKIFKSKYKEEDVQWCMDAVEREMTAIDIKKFLLLKGRKSKVSEMLFIFDQIQKKLKGGDQNGRQFKQSDGQVERQTQNQEENKKEKS